MKRRGFALRIGAMHAGWLRILIGATVLLVLTLSWARWRFGSLSTAQAYYRGQAVTVTAPRDQQRIDGSGAVAFALHVVNNSPEPVAIVGAHSSCGCAQFSGLPLTVPALQTGVMYVQMTAGTTQIILYTDSGRAPQVPVEISVTPDGATIVNSG